MCYFDSVQITKGYMSLTCTLSYGMVNKKLVYNELFVLRNFIVFFQGEKVYTP